MLNFGVKDVNHVLRRTHKPNRAPMQLVGLGYPLQWVTLDVMGLLPTTDRGNKCVGNSRLFYQVDKSLCYSEQESATIAKEFVDQFCCYYGMSETIHTDQGTNFQSSLFKETCRLLGIGDTRTTPYRPQANGLVEQFNKMSLTSYVQQDQKDWDLHLQRVLLAFGSSVQESTGWSPFFLMFGKEVRLPIDLLYGPPSPAVYVHDIQQ